MMTREERFWAKVRKTADCWIWTGSISNRGYGRLGKDYAHRLSVQFAGRLIPPKMHVDHVCCNQLCVNPAHLDVVTAGENIARSGVYARRTAAARSAKFCKRGHKLAEVGRMLRKGEKSPRCRACHSLHSMATYRRRKNAAVEASQACVNAQKEG